jgi:hypothetical protein
LLYCLDKGEFNLEGFTEKDVGDILRESQIIMVIFSINHQEDKNDIMLMQFDEHGVIRFRTTPKKRRASSSRKSTRERGNG